MRAIVCTPRWATETLALVDLPMPEPGPSEVGSNPCRRRQFSDGLAISGRYQMRWSIRSCPARRFRYD